MSIRRLFSALAAITILTATAHAQLYEHVQTLYDEIADPGNILTSPFGENIYVTNEASINVYQTGTTINTPILMQVVRDGVDGIEGLIGLYDLKMSGDGRALYASAIDSKTITVFERSIEDGSLRRIQTLRRGVDFQNGVAGIVLSPDGTMLYGFATEAEFATDSTVTFAVGQISLFLIDPTTGRITPSMEYRSGDGVIPEGATFDASVISSDGRHIYFSERVGSSQIHSFTRDGNLGTLVFNTSLPIEAPVDEEDRLSRLFSLTISGDGRFVYGTYIRGDNPHVFERDLATGNLELVQRAFATLPKELQDIRTGGSSWLSPDGTRFYVQLFGEDIAIMDRHIQTGLLTLLGFQDLGRDSNAGDLPRTAFAGTSNRLYMLQGYTDSIESFIPRIQSGTLDHVDTYRGEDGLGGLTQIAAPENDSNLYVLAYKDGSLSTLSRNPASGILSLGNVNREDVDLDIHDCLAFTTDGRFAYGPEGYRSTLDSVSGVPTLFDEPRLDGDFCTFVSQRQRIYVSDSGDSTIRELAINQSSGELATVDTFGLPSDLGNCGGLHATDDGKSIYFIDKVNNAIHTISIGATFPFFLAYIDSVALPSPPVRNSANAWGIDSSPDGNHMYIVTSELNLMHVFQRDRESMGQLTHLQTIQDDESKEYRILSPSSVVASLDDQRVFVTAGESLNLIVFKRDFNSGVLTFVEAQSHSVPGTNRNALPVDVYESTDGLYVYSSAAHIDGLAAYERRLPARARGGVYQSSPLTALPNSVVAMDDGHGNTHIAVGDANGRYSFDSYLSIPDGTYSARVMAPGYEPKDLPAFTFSGDDIDLGRTFMRRHAMNSTLVGTVTRSDSGLAIPGVRVEVQGGAFATDHTYTSANGTYEFAFADTKGKDDVALSIAEDDFTPYDTTATLLQDAETRVDILLDPVATTAAGGLSGTVNGPDSAVPFPQLTFTGPMRFTLIGDGMGYYTANGLTPGIYIVRVSAVGYAGRSHYVNVAAEKSYTRDFTLATGDFSDPSEDGVINSIDIQSVINAVLEGANAGSTGNVNGDDQVNAVDIQTIINAVLLGS